MLDFLKIDLSNNIAIFVIIVMFFFSLTLILKIKKLKDEIENLKFEDRSIFEDKVKNKDDVVFIGKISHDIEKEEESFVKEDVRSGKLEKDNVKNSVVENNIVETENIRNKDKNNDKVYNKKVLNDSPKTTSPVTIDRSLFDIESASFNLNEFVRNGERTAKKVSVKKTKIDYLDEISKKMADELKPQTIELTDYEKDQEENAIISYKELLSVKDKISMMNEDDETIDFIEELKKLRNSLN